MPNRTSADHAEEARFALRDAAKALVQVRHQLEAKDCLNAWRHINDTYYYLGSAWAHNSAVTSPSHKLIQDRYHALAHKLDQALPVFQDRCKIRGR